jgi:MoaA/NifB/PqqE/SkfB family radical SAM enzyme
VVNDHPSRDIGDLIGLALWRWGCSRPNRMRRVAGLTWRMLLAELRRRRRERRIDAPIPWVIAISPTMECNYDCRGCYSRGRPTDDELTAGELDGLLSEAEDLGVLAVVVTGGEPLLRDDLIGAFRRHPRLLFFLITNGALVTSGAAREISDSGNVIALVSIEGFPADTDGRRCPGAHDAALRALERLRDADACFGFAAMNTAVSTDHLGTDQFFAEMEGLGCCVGFLTEYVPTGADPEFDWSVAEDDRAAFRRRVLELREKSRVVLVQFPHDEYGESNRCTAAGRASLHIGSRGEVEPCPFVPVSCDNVRQGGLAAACRSPFMRAIRERPELLGRERFACALFEHRAEVEEIARRYAETAAGPEEAIAGGGRQVAP